MTKKADTPPKERPPKSRGGITQGQKIREEFSRQGLSVAEFARAEGFDRHLVYQVIDGRLKGSRGQSHNIAVALGLKQGVRTDKKAAAKKKQRDDACLTA